MSDDKPKTSKEAAIDLVEMILQLFPPYRWDAEQEKTYAQGLVAKLTEYSVEVIDKVHEKIRDERTDRRIPMPAEVLITAAEIDKWLKRSQGTLVLTQEQKQARFSAERERLANDICKGPIGRQAAREGWVLPLWNHIIEHNRAPDEQGIAACKRDAAETAELYDKLLRGEAGGSMRKTLLEFAESVDGRRKQLEKMILGEEAA